MTKSEENMTTVEVFAYADGGELGERDSTYTVARTTNVILEMVAEAFTVAGVVEEGARAMFWHDVLVGAEYGEGNIQIYTYDDFPEETKDEYYRGQIRAVLGAMMAAVGITKGEG